MASFYSLSDKFGDNDREEAGLAGMSRRNVAGGISCSGTLGCQTVEIHRWKESTFDIRKIKSTRTIRLEIQKLVECTGKLIDDRVRGKRIVEQQNVEGDKKMKEQIGWRKKKILSPMCLRVNR